MSKIAVLIPCYNEGQTIEKVVKDYRTVLPEADIYVYDNNSDDNTAELARRAGAIVCHEYRQGKGNVIRSMFRNIDADCYLIVDGDDTYPAESARDMVDLVLDKGVDMVVGDRLSSTYFAENKRPFHNLGNRIVRYLINKLFHSDVHDIMTGYRAFSPLFVKSFPVLSKGFEVETEMTIHAVDKNFLMEELPVAYRDRPEGSVSKLNTFADGVKVLHTIASLFKEYKPFQFFSAIAAVFWLISIGFFIPVLIDYYYTGLVLRFPTVVICGIVAVMGTLMWIGGIILEVIVKKYRQLYELMLNQMSLTGVGKNGDGPGKEPGMKGKRKESE